MRVARPVDLDKQQLGVLEQIARGRSLPARLVERARIVLRAARGMKDQQIASELGITPEKAARWRVAIRSDSGPEMTSRHFLAWCIERRIDAVHIQPGKPTQNAHVESFHGRLRDECLNVGWFWNLFDARSKIAAWRADYSCQRPHSGTNGHPVRLAMRSGPPLAT